MPSPRTIGIGLRLPCADHEKIVCRLVSETISSAVIGALTSVVVIWALTLSPQRHRDHREVSFAFRGRRESEPPPVCRLIDERGQTPRARLLLFCADHVMHRQAAIPGRLLAEKLPGFPVVAELFLLLRVEGRGLAFIGVDARLFLIALFERARAGWMHQSLFL